MKEIKCYCGHTTYCDCGPLEEQTQDNDFLVWDKLFAKLAWKFKPTKSGDMLIDAEAVYKELKNDFNLTFKQQEQCPTIESE